MLRVGLTGGIAAGKSLAAQALERCGAMLVDADALAREVVEPGTPGLSAVTREFGPGVLDTEGRLDRPALAALVFGNEERRRTLNGIIHPLVRARAAEILAATAPETVVVQDIPLLVETGQDSAFHLVVVVEAPLEVRVERMVTQRGMARDAALARIAAQADDAQRRAAADVVIENTGAAEDLRSSIEQLWEQRILPYNQNLLHARAVPAWPGAGAVGPAAVGRLTRRL
uniref:dephospho-CoA kinase n=1 Tax=Arthrobacter sp. TaxID=1667 RepID=UPI00289F0B02